MKKTPVPAVRFPNDSAHQRFFFDCVFTDETRKLFRAKRLQLGLTYTSLAHFLKVNWSTLRKWELGPTNSCELTFRPLIEGFLNGDFDSVLMKKNNNRKSQDNSDLPEPFDVFMERLGSIIRLCSNNDRIVQELIQNLEKAIQDTMAEIITNQIIGLDA